MIIAIVLQKAIAIQVVIQYVRTIMQSNYKNDSSGNSNSKDYCNNVNNTNTNNDNVLTYISLIVITTYMIKKIGILPRGNGKNDNIKNKI